MTLTFVNNPQLPFRVQQAGTMVQIKPFAGYYIWLDWFDLAPLDQTALIEIVAIAASEAGVAAIAAQTDANTAIANAATAQFTAEAANFNAGGAAILAGAAQADADAAQADADAAQADADAALAAAAAVPVEYPTSYFINPRSMKVNSVGFAAFGVATTDVFNGGYLMIGLNAEVEVHLPLMAGNYKFMAMCAKYSSCGKVTLYLDGSAVSEIDLYSAATVRNQEILWTLNSVAKGAHAFRVKITDKHASSLGYQLACSFMSLWMV